MKSLIFKVIGYLFIGLGVLYYLLYFNDTEFTNLPRLIIDNTDYSGALFILVGSLMAYLGHVSGKIDKIDAEEIPALLLENEDIVLEKRASMPLSTKWWNSNSTWGLLLCTNFRVVFIPISTFRTKLSATEYEMHEGGYLEYKLEEVKRAECKRFKLWNHLFIVNQRDKIVRFHVGGKSKIFTWISAITDQQKRLA